MPDLNPPTRPAPTKQDTLSDRLRHAPTTEAARRALAERDVTTVYRLLTETDISQPQIAQLTVIHPDKPAMRAALTERDVTRIFRLLVDGGMAQRQIAHLVKMNQSNGSEILSGRQVMGYDVLVRVADGLVLQR